MLLSSHEHVAGSISSISYYVDLPEGTSLRLLALHNFGVHSWQADVKDCIVSFQTPSVLWDHSGEVILKLFFKQRLLSEEMVEILPDTSYAPLVEAYCGPKQILTGGEDFTMVIGTGLDSLDNPWPKGTPIDYEYLFKSTLKRRSVAMKALHSYTRFFSDDASGTPAISVTSKGSSFNEFNITLYPKRPITFNLYHDRAHNYADGKQIITLTTSVIKDELGNLIADGTLVYFKIDNSVGSTTYATASMLNGIDTIRLPAPKEAMSWTVQAYIEDYTKSTKMYLEYLTSVKPFPVVYEQNVLKIGPIKGFSDQFVPDHTEVMISLCNSDQHISSILYTENGKSVFHPEKINLARGLYYVELNCGGQIIYDQIEVL